MTRLSCQLKSRCVGSRVLNTITSSTALLLLLLLLLLPLLPWGLCPYCSGWLLPSITAAILVKDHQAAKIVVNPHHCLPSWTCKGNKVAPLPLTTPPSGRRPRGGKDRADDDSLPPIVYRRLPLLLLPLLSLSLLSRCCVHPPLPSTVSHPSPSLMPPLHHPQSSRLLLLLPPITDARRTPSATTFRSLLPLLGNNPLAVVVPLCCPSPS